MNRSIGMALGIRKAYMGLNDQEILKKYQSHPPITSHLTIVPEPLERVLRERPFF
jgi:hypothetical protein